MYICPTCSKEFNTEDAIRQHFLVCWKEQHPYHKSKPAPRSANIETRKVNADMAMFFNSLQERK